MKKLLPLMFATLLSSQLMAMETPKLSCVGTEPFWGLETKGSVLSFDDFDKNSQYTITSVSPAAGTQEGWTTLITSVKGTEKLNLIVKTEECNDGMSDNVYKYSAFVQSGDSLLIGCCNDN